MAERKRKNPDDFVSREFCDERTARVEQLVAGMENRILNAINKRNSMSWQAKATIAASLITAAAAITVALLR